MKRIALGKLSGFFAVALLAVTSCGGEGGGGGFSQSSIQGNWKISSIEAVVSGVTIKVSESDDLSKLPADQKTVMNATFRVEGNKFYSQIGGRAEQSETFKSDGTFEGDGGEKITTGTSTSLIVEGTKGDSKTTMRFRRP